MRAADESAARAWLLGLPSSVRASVLDSLYTHPRPGRRMVARAEYCRVLASAWRLLYTPDWRGLLLPDTLSLLQQRPDISTDSPAAQLEDVERVLRRLGVVPATLPPVCAGHAGDGGKGGHVGHAELHCSVYELLLSFPACSARTVQLRPYASKQLHSARERQLVRALVPQLSRVTQLDLGHAADDVILQQVRAGHCSTAALQTVGRAEVQEMLVQVGATCGQLRKLSIAGSEVTDSGLELLLEAGRGSGLCRALASVSVTGTALVTLHGLAQLLAQLPRLAEFRCQESLVLQLLRSASCRQLRVPVRQLELTLGPGRRDYLGPASAMFPLLTQLTLWCFEAETSSSLGGFYSWTSWRRLSQVTLNNVAYCDLLDILTNIGHQLLQINIDNFSNDETDIHIFLDVWKIARLCPSLQSLSIAMAFLDYQPPKCDTASGIFSSLSSLHLKSNKYRSRGVLPAILAAATQLSSLTLQFQVSRPALAVEDAETLSDDDLQVELQTKVREDFTITGRLLLGDVK